MIFKRLCGIAPTAGLSSNAADMAKWLKFLLDQGHKDHSIVKTTLTPQTVVKSDMFFPSEEFWMEKVFFS